MADGGILISTSQFAMRYQILLIESEEGFAVGCPTLSGCWSQGATRQEAIENIREAIREVLEVKAELEAEQFRGGRVEGGTGGHRSCRPCLICGNILQGCRPGA